MRLAPPEEQYPEALGVCRRNVAEAHQAALCNALCPAASACEMQLACQCGGLTERARGIVWPKSCMDWLAGLSPSCMHTLIKCISMSHHCIRPFAQLVVRQSRRGV